MSSTITRGLAAAAALALTVSLAGCQLLTRAEPEQTGSQESPASATPASAEAVKAGDCIAEYLPNVNGSQDPVLNTVVDCSEPHHFLVFATTPVDATLLDGMGTTEEEIALRRDDIRLSAGTRYEAYSVWAEEYCRGEIRSLTGLGAVPVLYDVSGADVNAVPAGQFYFDQSLSTIEEWVAGDAYLVCSLGWTDSGGDLVQRQLPSGADPADFFTSSFPWEVRACTQYGEVEHVNVSCDQPHWMELAVALDPWAHLGADARLAFDVQNATDEEWDQIDTFCEAFTPFVVGADDTTDTHFARAIWVFWDEREVPTHVVCGFAPEEVETMDVIGSIVGIGDGSPELVPASLV